MVVIKLHTPWLCILIDVTIALKVSSLISSVQSFMTSMGSLYRVSASAFFLPGRYRMVKLKSARSSIYLIPETFNLAVDVTCVRIIICKCREGWRIVQIVSKLVAHSPFQSQKF